MSVIEVSRLGNVFFDQVTEEDLPKDARYRDPAFYRVDENAVLEKMNKRGWELEKIDQNAPDPPPAPASTNVDPIYRFERKLVRIELANCPGQPNDYGWASFPFVRPKGMAVPFEVNLKEYAILLCPEGRDTNQGTVELLDEKGDYLREHYGGECRTRQGMFSYLMSIADTEALISLGKLSGEGSIQEQIESIFEESKDGPISRTEATKILISLTGESQPQLLDDFFIARHKAKDNDL